MKRAARLSRAKCKRENLSRYVFAERMQAGVSAAAHHRHELKEDQQGKQIVVSRHRAIIAQRQSAPGKFN
jgi:hypothetical protein